MPPDAFSNAPAIAPIVAPRSIRRLTSWRFRGLRLLPAFAGPAVIVSVAFMDPGNFATNIEAGAHTGYELLWVVVASAVVAMLFQSLSAKLGIVTGHNLAELCRATYPSPLVWIFWIVSELAAMATDLAEFLGSAIGLKLLLGVPLLGGALATGVLTYLILSCQKTGYRRVELLIGGFVCLIGLCYVGEIAIAPINWPAAAYHAFVPQLADHGALTLAAAIVGATVMPHVIYLHSGLTQSRLLARVPSDKRVLLRLSRQEVILALGIAGLINFAMVLMAAAVFHDGSHNGVASIETAYHTLLPLAGTWAATLFLAALIFSGISSSVVGTMAGQVIMQGFVGFAIPLWLRRLLTMLPAIIIIAMGVDVTKALVVSQIVLCLILPLPLLLMLDMTRRPSVMGGYVNGRMMSLVVGLVAGVVVVLNIALVVLAIGFGE